MASADKKPQALIKDFYEKFGDSTDIYGLFELSIDATDKEISKAYKKLSLIFHPDKQKNKDDVEKATQKFHQIKEARDLLLNVPVRAEIDRRLRGELERKKTIGKLHGQRQQAAEELERREREAAGFRPAAGSDAGPFRGGASSSRTPGPFGTPSSSTAKPTHFVTKFPEEQLRKIREENRAYLQKLDQERREYASGTREREIRTHLKRLREARVVIELKTEKLLPSDAGQKPRRGEDSVAISNENKRRVSERILSDFESLEREKKISGFSGAGSGSVTIYSKSLLSRAEQAEGGAGEKWTAELQFVSRADARACVELLLQKKQTSKKHLFPWIAKLPRLVEAVTMSGDEDRVQKPRLFGGEEEGSFREEDALFGGLGAGGKPEAPRFASFAELERNILGRVDEFLAKEGA